MNLYIHSKIIAINYLTKFSIFYTLFLTILTLIVAISIIFFKFDLLILLVSAGNSYFTVGLLILFGVSDLSTVRIQKKYNKQISIFVEKHFNSISITSVFKLLLLLCSPGIIFTLLLSLLY